VEAAQQRWVYLAQQPTVLTPPGFRLRDDKPLRAFVVEDSCRVEVLLLANCKRLPGQLCQTCAVLQHLGRLNVARCAQRYLSILVAFRLSVMQIEAVVTALVLNECNATQCDVYLLLLATNERRKSCDCISNIGILYALAGLDTTTFYLAYVSKRRIAPSAYESAPSGREVFERNRQCARSRFESSSK
jgi:hypothetical protein